MNRYEINMFNDVRRILLTILLMCILHIANSQNDKAVISNLNLKQTGLILTGVGIPVFLGGIALGIKTEGFSYEYSNTNGEVVENGKPINGVAGFMTILGGFSTGGGIALAIIGHKQNKEQKALSINVLPNKLYLCYKF